MSQPQRIDRYEVKGILGHGAMGHVYLAWDPKLHREVALKVVAKSLSREAKGRQRFHREARAIAALKHPNIVEIYDYSGEESSDLYLVMERLDGDDLFNIMNDKGMMPEAAAAAVGHELCLALAVAHESGIIHRDIKPENVFMNSAGRVVLTDFGVVKAIREGSAVDGWSVETDVIGTPGFMAPELMMNRALGPRTDIFALGALLYNVTTGDMPFAGDSPVEIFRNVVASRMVDPRSFNARLSDEFVEVLSGCLQAKPKKRFRSAEQVREQLKSVLEQNGVSDLRDDLRDFMRDPSDYTNRANKRAVNYQADKLKVAIKDRDEASERLVKKRLRVIDPDNEVVNNISGIHNVDASLVRASLNAEGRSTGRQSGQSLYIVVGVLVVLAVVLAGYLAFRSDGNSAATLDATAAEEFVATPGDEHQEPADQKPSLKSALTSVSVNIRGGLASIYLNGRSLGRHKRHTFKAPKGRHTLEIRGNRKKLRRRLELNGKPVRVNADLRCKKNRSCITVN